MYGPEECRGQYGIRHDVEPEERVVFPVPDVRELNYLSCPCVRVDHALRIGRDRWPRLQLEWKNK